MNFTLPSLPRSDWMRATAPSQPFRWLDLCCGTGKALVEANRVVRDQELSGVEITGVDDRLEANEPHRRRPRFDAVRSAMTFAAEVDQRRRGAHATLIACVDMETGIGSNPSGEELDHVVARRTTSDHRTSFGRVQIARASQRGSPGSSGMRKISS